MAIIKEIGTISFLGEIRSGVSQNGNPWANRQVVFDVEGYNGSFRKVLVLAGTDRVQDLEAYPLGSRVEFGYQVRARQYDGKWYNNVDLYTLAPAPGAGVQAPQPYPQAPQAAAPQPYPQQPPQYAPAPQGAETGPQARQIPGVAQGPVPGPESASVASNGHAAGGRRRPPVQSRPQIPPQPVTGQHDPYGDFPAGFDDDNLGF